MVIHRKRCGETNLNAEEVKSRLLTKVRSLWLNFKNKIKKELFDIIQ